MKNWAPAAVSVPALMTRAVSTQAAMKVARLTNALASGAQRRAPNTASRIAPVSGMASSRTIPTLLVLPQILEMVQVEAVELLADLEEEHPQHQHRDQDVERHAELDDHRHAVSRTHRAEEQAVLHRQESDHLRHGLAARDHGQE